MHNTAVLFTQIDMTYKNLSICACMVYRGTYYIISLVFALRYGSGSKESSLCTRQKREELIAHVFFFF